MKRFLFLIVSILLIAVVTGCNSSKKDATTNSQNENNQNTAKKKGDYPKKPITLIVPFSAGGGTDATARALASSAEKYLGQSIGVVNKTGGDGAVGFSAGANAKPDGYTVLFGTVELTTLHHLDLTNVSYKDLEPIAQINEDPAAVTVSAKSPYHTLKDFLDYAKKNPKKLRVGTLGTGDIWDFAATGIEQESGAKFTHVPFDGAAPAVTSLLGEHIDAVTVSPAEVLPQVKAGKLRMLAVMDDKKSKVLPDVPTFKEAGFKIKHPVGTWRGVFVPKDTPDEVTKVLKDAFMKAAKTDKFKKYMHNNGLGIKIKNAADFEKNMKENDEYFGDLVKKFGLKK